MQRLRYQAQGPPGQGELAWGATLNLERSIWGRARLCRYSRHMVSSSSSPWAQVRTPSQTLLAGMQLLWSWHKKPVLFVSVTQVWAPELAGGDPRGARVVCTRASQVPPTQPHTELSRGSGVAGRMLGWVVTEVRLKPPLCHFLAVRPWADDLTSLSLTFLFCTVGTRAHTP